MRRPAPTLCLLLPLAQGALLLAPAPRPAPRAHARLSSSDPFRPENPPIEPMVINAIQELLTNDGRASADAVAEAALHARRADPDYTLTAAEEQLLTSRVLRVGAARGALLTLLEAAVAATPWVTKYAAEASFGLGSLADPYVAACRAECMLGALVLHAEGGTVAFLDEERLEVLRGAAPPAAISAVRAAALDMGEDVLGEQACDCFGFA